MKKIKQNYRAKSIEKALEKIDQAQNWSDMNVEIYKDICEELKLNYSEYSDPDELYDDMVKAYKAIV